MWGLTLSGGNWESGFDEAGVMMSVLSKSA